jgi:hypothetical protein
VVSNSVVTTVTSPMTELRFGGGVDTISVSYDSSSGKFLPAMNMLSGKADMCIHHEARL